VNTAQSEWRRIRRQVVLIAAQRAVLVCLCIVLAVVVALTYIYHHPITKLRLWRGSFPELIVAIGLIAAWPYVLAMAMCWAPRKPDLVRAVGFAVVVVLSASWVMEEIVHNVEMAQHTRDMVLFTGLQAVFIGVASAILGFRDDP